ncbi:glycerate kinase type-2 family protein [Acidilobus sp.]|uniref:glycerate kinase type-2 family protein n=1 Tax=Acidilobus sp. TaxID=1872109 RepID=UPI003D01F8BA
MRPEQLKEKIINVSLNSSSLYGKVKSKARELVKALKDGYLVISMGKASIAMLKGFIDGSGLEPIEGLIVKPRGLSYDVALDKININIIEAGHPLPDEGSLRAGEKALMIAKKAGELERPLVVLVSGGGSAMVESPIEGVSLEDLVAINRLLLNSGASISEINVVRRHLSRVKGGGLVKASGNAEVYGLYASDVPGDFLEDIASGPTAPDPTTFRDALEVLERYELLDQAPESVVKVLRKGEEGAIEETLKPGDPRLRRVTNVIVASAFDVVDGVAKALSEEGYNTIILTTTAQGESREVGKFLASITFDIIRKGVPLKPPAAIVVGGETSVSVKGHGLGGRNQELAISWALELRRLGIRGDEALMIAMATDGIDGPTDAAGAAITPGSIDLMYRSGVNPVKALIENDSYHALAAADALIKTGPTGSNLNNVIVILVSDHER